MTPTGTTRTEMKMKTTEKAPLVRLQQIELIRQRALAEIKALLPDVGEDEFDIEVSIFPDSEAVVTLREEAREASWLFGSPDDPQLKGWYKSTDAENGGCVTVYI